MAMKKRIVCFLMVIGINFLPAFFAYVFLGILLADVAVMIVLANTICKK